MYYIFYPIHLRRKGYKLRKQNILGSNYELVNFGGDMELLKI